MSKYFPPQSISQRFALPAFVSHLLVKTEAFYKNASQKRYYNLEKSLVGLHTLLHWLFISCINRLNYCFISQLRKLRTDQPQANIGFLKGRKRRGGGNPSPLILKQGQTVHKLKIATFWDPNNYCKQPFKVQKELTIIKSLKSTF